MRIITTSSVTFALVFFCLFAIVQSTCLKGTKCNDATCTTETCTACLIGQYQETNTWAETTCKRCPAGREYTTGNDARELECTECGAGYYQSENNNPSVVDCNAWATCDAGKKVSVVPNLSTNRVCVWCETGRYEDVSGNEETFCKFCPKGYFYNNLQSCVGCYAGKYQDQDDLLSAACKQCVSGSQLISASEGCLICAAGQYKDNPSTDNDCIDCPTGRYQTDDSVDAANHNNVADCKFCAAGFSFKTKKLPCVSKLI